MVSSLLTKEKVIRQVGEKLENEKLSKLNLFVRVDWECNVKMINNIR